MDLIKKGEIMQKNIVLLRTRSHRLKFQRNLQTNQKRKCYHSDKDSYKQQAKWNTTINQRSTKSFKI